MNDAARYRIVIAWSDEDGCYIGYAPELPGLITHGNDRAALLVKVEERIGEWLAIVAGNGFALPAPQIFDYDADLPERSASAQPAAAGTPAAAR